MNVYLLTNGMDCLDCGQAATFGVYITKGAAEAARDALVAQRVEHIAKGRRATSGLPVDLRETARLRAELAGEYEITERQVEGIRAVDHPSAPDRRIVTAATRIASGLADRIADEMPNNEERYSCLGFVIGQLASCGFLGLKDQGATPDEARSWLSDVFHVVGLQLNDYGYTVSLAVGEKRA